VTRRASALRFSHPAVHGLTGNGIELYHAGGITALHVGGSFLVARIGDDTPHSVDVLLSESVSWVLKPAILSRIGQYYAATVLRRRLPAPALLLRRISRGIREFVRFPPNGGEGLMVPWLVLQPVKPWWF